MGNYFTTFHLLTHPGVNNIQATVLLNKYRFHKSAIAVDKLLQKKEHVYFEQRQSGKHNSATFIVGYNNNKVVYIVSFGSS